MSQNEELKAEAARLSAELGVYKSLLEAEQSARQKLLVEAAMLRAELDAAERGHRRPPMTGGGPETRPLSMEERAPVPGLTEVQFGAILQGLQNMTAKQRAVTFATLDGSSYREIANVMGVDETTVKIHLKAALAKLGSPSRATLLAHAKEIVKELERIGYTQMFEEPLDWMATRPAEVMQKLIPRTRTAPPPGGKVQDEGRGRKPAKTR